MEKKTKIQNHRQRLSERREIDEEKIEWYIKKEKAMEN